MSTILHFFYKSGEEGKKGRARGRQAGLGGKRVDTVFFFFFWIVAFIFIISVEGPSAWGENIRVYIPLSNQPFPCHFVKPAESGILSSAPLNKHATVREIDSTRE